MSHEITEEAAAWGLEAEAELDRGRIVIRIVIRKILLAVDFGDDSRRAEALASELGRSLEAEVTVLHVREWLIGPAGPFDEGRRQATDLVGRVADRLQVQGLRVRHETRSAYFAHTAKQIVQTAREEGADLIVLGPHRRAGPIRTRLGRNVTTWVLRNSKVPVLVAA